MTGQNRAHFYGIAARLTRRILADNVKCNHGATSGQISEDEMFYLLSRGIPAPVAKKQLLVSGFLNEVVD